MARKLDRAHATGNNNHLALRPVRKWIPTGIAKAADEFANHGTASIERFYQAIQAVLIPFVPLLGNIRRKLPDLVRRHMLGSTQRGFERIPSPNILVNAIIGIHSP